MGSNQYEKKYNDLMECLRQMHENNLRRTKIALRSLIIIPTIFLVLWIVSMFIIAVILIVVEYQDFTLRRIMTDAEADGPVPIESFEYDNYEEAPSDSGKQ